MPIQPQTSLAAIDAAWAERRLPQQWAEVVEGVDATTVLTLLWLSRLARTFEASVEAHARDHGLGATELRLLTALLLEGKPYRASPTRLNDTVLVSPGGVSKTVDRLENLGLVARRPDPSDGRGVQVALSRKGRNVAQAVLRELLNALDDQLTTLTTDKRDGIVDALRTLLSTFPDASMPTA